MKINVIRGENQIGGNIVEISTDTTKILLDAGLELDSDNKTLPDIDFNDYDAIFVSHYHSDHVGLIYGIDSKIPVYIGEASYQIIKASDSYKKIKSFTPKGFLSHKKTIKIGDISVTPFLCDHSAFDSYMLLCEADGEKILYTGDFRSNGRKSFNILLNELPKVDKLICEGTTLSRDGYQPITEKELEQKAIELFKNTKGPVFVLQSATNIDRIVTMYRAAKRSDRIFLEEVYMANVAKAAGNNIPNPDFDDVYAFITNPSKYSMITKYKRRASKKFIAKHKFVMCIRNSMLNYLKSLSKLMSFEGGLLVYSFWSGYRESESMQNFLSECEKMGLEIVTLHTGGHADEKAIKNLIDTVTPEEIIPIHTESPEKLKELFKGEKSE